MMVAGLAGAGFYDATGAEVGVAEGDVLGAVSMQHQVGQAGFADAVEDFLTPVDDGHDLTAVFRVAQRFGLGDDRVSHRLVLCGLDRAFWSLALDIQVNLAEVADRERSGARPVDVVEGEEKTAQILAAPAALDVLTHIAQAQRRQPAEGIDRCQAQAKGGPLQQANRRALEYQPAVGRQPVIDVEEFVEGSKAVVRQDDHQCFFRYKGHHFAQQAINRLIIVEYVGQDARGRRRIVHRVCLIHQMPNLVLQIVGRLHDVDEQIPRFLAQQILHRARPVDLQLFAGANEDGRVYTAPFLRHAQRERAAGIG